MLCHTDYEYEGVDDERGNELSRPGERGGGKAKARTTGDANQKTNGPRNKKQRSGIKSPSRESSPKGFEESTAVTANNDGSLHGLSAFPLGEVSREASLSAIQLIRMSSANQLQRANLVGSSVGVGVAGGGGVTPSAAPGILDAVVAARLQQFERQRVLSGVIASGTNPALLSQLSAVGQNPYANQVGQQQHQFHHVSSSNRSHHLLPQQLQHLEHQQQEQLSPHVVQYLQMQAFNRFQQQQPQFPRSGNFDFQHSALANYESRMASVFGQQQRPMVPQINDRHVNFGGQRLEGSMGRAYASYGGRLLPNMPTSLVNQSSLSSVVGRQGGASMRPQGGIPLYLPAILACPADTLKLSSHQVLLRHQIEAFQATDDDVSTHTRGRNKPVSLGQVGIRCRHCAHLPVSRRQKGSTYFPATMLGLYQASQNMSTTHMQCGLCSEMPESIKTQFAQVISTKVASSGAGRPYWAASANQLGMVDTENGIFFIRNLPSGVRLLNNDGSNDAHTKTMMHQKKGSSGN